MRSLGKKYFLNMEKRQFNAKVISRLKLENNHVITDPDLILNEEKNFYEKLYSAEHKKLDLVSFSNFMLGMPTLNEEEALYCERDFTETEIYECILSLNVNKTPGTDGYPSEFYKVMWPHIKKLLINCYSHIGQCGKMSITQRQGIIILIAKKGKDGDYLKNWRPLSLLNTDYKILAKCIANRL